MVKSDTTVTVRAVHLHKHNAVHTHRIQEAPLESPSHNTHALRPSKEHTKTQCAECAPKQPVAGCCASKPVVVGQQPADAAVVALGI